VALADRQAVSGATPTAAVTKKSNTQTFATKDSIHCHGSLAEE
jgi:hypothetical protein